LTQRLFALPLFRIHLVHLNYQMNDSDHRDSDWLYMAVKVGNKPPAIYAQRIGSLLTSGHTVILDDRYGLPVDVADGESVLFTFFIANQAYAESGGPPTTFFQVAGQVSDALGPAIAPATAAAGLWAGVGVAAGQVAFKVLGIIGQLDRQADCDGRAVQEALTFTAGDLAARTNNDSAVVREDKTYFARHTPSKCGHDGETLVVYSYGPPRSYPGCPKTFSSEGALLGKYLEYRLIDPNILGCPIDDAHPTPNGDGRYQHYQGGSVYENMQLGGPGAHIIYGGIRGTWANMGWERSWLSWPTSDELPFPGGRIQYFQRGKMIWWWDRPPSIIAY